MKFMSRARHIVILLCLCGVIAHAQTTTPTSTMGGDILSQFQSLRASWILGIFGYANRLFWTLAVIELAWATALLALQHADLHAFAAMLIRRIMFVGFWYAVLLNGGTWIPDIIDSFARIGMGAAHISAPLSPSQMFIQGLELVRIIGASASTAAFFTDPAAVFILSLAGWGILVAFALITANYIVTIIEAYVVLSVGFIFLGFGGSRWTVPYAERYISSAIAIGVKVLLLYCLISGGMVLTGQWATEAATMTTAPSPSIVALDILGGSLILMICCWQIPKFLSSVLAGTVAGSVSDFIAPVATTAGMALGGASMAASAIASPATSAVAGGMLAATRAALGYVGIGNPTTSSGGGSGVTSGSPSAGSAMPSAVPPPSSGGGNPLGSAARAIKSFRLNDGGGHVSPPSFGKHD